MNAILATLLAALPPKPETGFGMPHDASVDGHRIDWLINVTSIFVLILFVITVIWMVYACLRHNTKHTAEYDHGDSKHAITVAMIFDPSALKRLFQSNVCVAQEGTVPHAVLVSPSSWNWRSWTA